MTLIKTIRRLLPVGVFLLLVMVCWRGLFLHPTQVPSPLINKPVPAFELPLLADPNKGLSQRDFIGHVTLLNVWASWCYACAAEHAFLMELTKKDYIVLYGLNYKDDLTAAKEWLEKNGNPYQEVAVDANGKVALDWGVYGTPETFLIDPKGVIRYKQIGPVTPEIWKQTLQPIIERIRGESA